MAGNEWEQCRQLINHRLDEHDKNISELIATVKSLNEQAIKLNMTLKYISGGISFVISFITIALTKLIALIKS